MTRKLIPHLFFFWLACFAFTLTVRSERLPVKIYTSADGLGSSASLRLVRDSRGFIWLCSRDGLVRFDGYRFITYRIGNDDADPAVFNLLPTRNGVYWINLNTGTDYRFIDKGDATSLEPTQQQLSRNDPRVPLVNVESIKNLRFPSFEDNAGNLWSFEPKGLDLLREVDGRTVSQLIELNLSGNPQEGLKSVAFRDGGDGSLWLGTPFGLVRRLVDGRIVHFTFGPQNNSAPINIFAEDRDSRVWIARPEGILVLKVEPISQLTGSGSFSPRPVVIKPGKVAPDGQAQLPTQPGEAFTFAFRDLFRNDAGEKSNGESALKPAVWGLVCAADGKTWIANTGGLVLYDGKRFQHFTEAHGLASNHLAQMVEDNEGQIWLSSYGGLMRLNPKGLISFDIRDGLADRRVNSIYENRRGELNVVTDNWNISQLRNGAFKTARPRLPDGLATFWRSNVAFLDSRGDWWVITNKGLYRYSGVDRIEELSGRQPAAVYTDQNGLIANEAANLFEDSRGDIWISSFAGAKRSGLARWQRASNQFQHFLAADGLPAVANSASFTEDKAGALWFGFSGGGLSRFRNSRFTSFGVKDGLLPGPITSLLTDSKGRLWIASSISGLSRVDDPAAEHPVFRHYTIADGLTSNNIRCLTEDSFGNIYVGTVRGVNRLSPETGHLKYYGTGDGLAGDFVSAALRDRNGAIWFGTFNGLSKLLPEPDVPAPAAPTLISGLRIAGVDYSVSPLGQTEVVAPEQTANRNNLQIDFFSINVGGNESIRYQYKLEGADQDWSPPTIQRTVNFANLRPADYRFLVQAVNADGIAGKPATLRFRILPPIWLRWWFIALATLLALTSLYSVYRFRIARLREVNAALAEAKRAEEDLGKAREERLAELERVRTRIATDLHDDIGASLTQIAILSEVAQQQNKASSGGVGQPLQMISSVANELVGTMSDIVWAINPQRDHLRDLTQRMRRFASDVLSARGIAFEFNAPATDSDIPLGANLRREVFLIFKESVNNVVKHSNATRAEIDLNFSNHHLTLKIADNGKGFESAKSTRALFSNDGGGNGILSMKRRAREMNGELEITSEVSKGSVITLRLPLGT